MIGAKPRRLQVIDALVDVVKRVPGIRGAAHDVPFAFERRTHPFAYVYDLDEVYDLGSVHGQSDNSLSVEVDVVFEWAEEANKTPRKIGNQFLAFLLREVALDRKLGGAARDTQPTGSAIRELATDNNSNLAACSVQFAVNYHYPQTDPFVTQQ